MATSSRFSFRRLPWLVFKAVIWFVVISVAWVALYRFVPPPVTFTMLGNALDGRGIHKDWLPLSAMDPDRARGAIAGEDAKIGRGACRERVCQYVEVSGVEGELKKKKK